MKNATIAVLVILLAIAGYVIAKEKMPDRGSPPVAGGGMSIKTLSPSVTAALGAERAATVAVVGYDGSIQLWVPEGSEYKVKLLPVDAKIQAIVPLSIITYEGSRCVAWVPAVTIGGQEFPGFCAKWAK